MTFRAKPFQITDKTDGNVNDGIMRWQELTGNARAPEYVSFLE